MNTFSKTIVFFLLYFYFGFTKRPKFLIKKFKPKYPWENEEPNFDYVDEWDLERINQGHRLNFDLAKEFNQKGLNNKSSHLSVNMLKNRLEEVDYTNLTKPRWEVMSYDIEPSIREKRDNKIEKKMKNYEKQVKMNMLAQSSLTKVPKLVSFAAILKIKKKFDFNLLSQKEKDMLPWKEPKIMSNCWIQKMLSTKYSFSPSCQPDGSFAYKQCYLGRCWCVNDKGTPRIKKGVERFYFRSDGLKLKCFSDIFRSNIQKFPVRDDSINFERVYEKENKLDESRRKYMKTGYEENYQN